MFNQIGYRYMEFVWQFYCYNYYIKYDYCRIAVIIGP